jgi:superfamily II RNA helicase
VLNLLQKSTLEQAEYLIRKSFGQFTSERRLDPVEAELKEKTAELEEALNFTCTYGVSDKEFHGYLKSRELLSESGRYVKILQKQLKQHGKSREMIQELARETGKKKNLTQTVEASPCNTCPIINKHRRVEERIHKLQRQLKYLNIDYERQHDIYWRSFKHLYLLLKDAGCLVSDDDMVAVATPKGVLTSQVRTENELFLTEIITEGLLDSLTPPQLGGILCSLVNDSNRENLWSKLRASPETWQAVMDIQRIAKRIRKLQEKYAVEVPIIVNPVAVGLVEAWCQGMTWQQLISETNIDEGDLVRMIRRTADLLRQLSRIGEISPELNRKAQQALAMLYRDPVKEVEVTEEVDEALIESE